MASPELGSVYRVAGAFSRAFLAKTMGTGYPVASGLKIKGIDLGADRKPPETYAS
jgi:hypothetical protein